MWQGLWTFFAVSVDTVDDRCSITIYYGGTRRYYLDSLPEEKLGK